MRKTLGFLVMVMVMFTVLATGMEQGAAATGVPHVDKESYRAGNSQLFLPKVAGGVDEKNLALINSNLKNKILSLAGPDSRASLHGDFEVVFNNGKLLVIQFVGYTFIPGMAHPNKIDQGIHIDLSTGKIYSLADLFLPGIDYAAKVLEITGRSPLESRLAIEGLWDGWTHDDFVNSWSGVDQAYLLQMSSLRVYSIPRYATGSISGYQVRYADLIDSIDQAGPLWQALRQNIIDKNRLKIGDVVAGLKVIALERRNNSLLDVTFAGEVELEGTSEWLENNGDGPGYIFTVRMPEAAKLPALGLEKETRLIGLQVAPHLSTLLPQAQSRVRLVIDRFSLGERQIAARAKVVQVTLLN
jgi:hypothetical protein